MINFINILAKLDPRCRQSPGLVAGGHWAVRMPSYDGFKFNAIMRGGLWLVPDGDGPVQLGEGDCFLLADGQGFTVASELGLVPLPAETVFADARHGVAQIGLREDVVIVAGKMTLHPTLAPYVQRILPPVSVFRAATSEAQSVRWLLDRIAQETNGDGPAIPIVADRLIELIFIELLRSTMSSQAREDGWPGALSDPRLATVLNAMHAEPSRRWTLSELASKAHMSRSVFAKAFSRNVGLPPLQYLKRMRLLIAGNALRTQGASVSAAASLAGYASDSAFSVAFRGVFSCTPAQYKREPVVSRT
ncbi:MAG TPA: AraC family transcriptional regulator [Pseudoduganella sp.]